MTACWGITDGSAGMVAQVRSLALAMGLPPEMKIISLKKPWSLLPNICYDSFLQRFILSHALRRECYSLLSICHPALVAVTPPNGGAGDKTNGINCDTRPRNKCGVTENPDIIISCGRKAALVALALKKKNPQIKIICIQDPQMSSRHFDVVVAMQHDRIKSHNVIKTLFALHSITPEILAEAKEKFMPRFATYPQPHIAVLLGGSTNKYTLTKERMEVVITDLQEWLAGTKGSLLITPSRRTGAENIAALQQAFAGNKNVYIYDGVEENPYMGLLACADEIIVTNDSVNMMSEAFATGKPVTILEMEGHEKTKPARFAEMIKHHPPLKGDEMQKLAGQVRAMLG